MGGGFHEKFFRRSFSDRRIGEQLMPNGDIGSIA